ncbi:MAG: hypothetical protein M0021_11920 [Clostridia bacterium]|nr:hypothetical protein [Clostridia bacterium]
MHQEIDKNPADSVGLLVSLLVRYPEITSINYEPERKVLRMSFLIEQVISGEQQLKLIARLKQYLEGHAYLKGQQPETIEVTNLTMERCTFLEIYRDVDTITKEEISLLIELLVEEFGGYLIVDSRNSDQEDQEVQEELIGHMLDHFRVLNQRNKLFAFREDGRVLVFNK